MEAKAIYSLPGTDNFCEVTGTVLESAPARISSGFVFHPFRETDETPVFAIEGPIKEWNGDENFGSDLPVSGHQPCTSQKDYMQLVHQAIALCRHGHEKVVTSRCFCLEEQMTGPPAAFLKQLKITYPLAFVYCFYIPGTICYIGASPEILIDQRFGAFTTVALAGTKLPGKEFNWTEKERQEHQTVVEYLVKKLENEQTLKVGETYEQKAAHLVHLRTDIKFKSKEPVMQLAKKLHPTPAICGMPAGQSNKWLKHHEGYDRHYYSGFMGPVELKGDSHLYVNLRCMQLFRNRICFYAGGGVNALSDPVKEWQETEEKINVLRNLVIGNSK